ncbi:MAG: hypothetical protein U5L98_14225 [Halomonas sp.]|uniref:hypothetical protein n=1 Tax=Halomonas sp. TaxID=1486246 RepID=UPI002ACD62D8|nr:hypothetical protein [Halomonas sp.]MDZ7853757.1 hypothetical protein [Halomonas sp.]
MTLLDPHRPTLAELLAVDQDNETFVRQLYRHLLGREPDPEGLAACLRGIPRRGRLFLLATMISSEESRCYRANAGIQLPPGARVYSPVGRLKAMGPPGRLMLLPMVAVFRTWEWWRGPTLALEARCFRTEARLRELETQSSQWFETLGPQLTRCLDSLLEQERDASYLQQFSIQVRRILEQGLGSLDGKATVSSPDVARWGTHQQHLIEELAQRWRNKP